MNSQEYYKEKFGIDLSKQPLSLSNAIASAFLEEIYLTKEELEYLIKKRDITQTSSHKKGKE